MISDYFEFRPLTSQRDESFAGPETRMVNRAQLSGRRNNRSRGRSSTTACVREGKRSFSLVDAVATTWSRASVREDGTLKFQDGNTSGRRRVRAGYKHTHTHTVRRGPFESGSPLVRRFFDQFAVDFSSAETPRTRERGEKKKQERETSPRSSQFPPPNVLSN